MLSLSVSPSPNPPHLSSHPLCLSVCSTWACLKSIHISRNMKTDKQKRKPWVIPLKRFWFKQVNSDVYRLQMRQRQTHLSWLGQNQNLLKLDQKDTHSTISPPLPTCHSPQQSYHSALRRLRWQLPLLLCRVRERGRNCAKDVPWWVTDVPKCLHKAELILDLTDHTTTGWAACTICWCVGMDGREKSSGRGGGLKPGWGARNLHWYSQLKIHLNNHSAGGRAACSVWGCVELKSGRKKGRERGCDVLQMH